MIKMSGAQQLLAVEVRRGRRSGRDRREIFEEFYREMRKRYAAALQEQLEAVGDREGLDPDDSESV